VSSWGGNGRNANGFASVGTGFEVPVPGRRGLDEGVDKLLWNGGREVLGLKGADRKGVVGFPYIKERNRASLVARADMFRLG